MSKASRTRKVYYNTQGLLLFFLFKTKQLKFKRFFLLEIGFMGGRKILKNGKTRYIPFILCDIPWSCQKSLVGSSISHIFRGGKILSTFITLTTFNIVAIFFSQCQRWCLAIFYSTFENPLSRIVFFFHFFQLAHFKCLRT